MLCYWRASNTRRRNEKANDRLAMLQETDTDNIGPTDSSTYGRLMNTNTGD